MTDDELAVIEARAAKATPGEWRACGEGACSCGMIWSTIADVPVAARLSAADEIYTGGCGVSDPDMLRANFEFIAHARTDVPALVSRIRELTAERDAAIAQRKV